MHPTDLNRILVVDVESTCWESHPPADQRSEIIEIGACELTLPDAAVSDPVAYFIRPEQSEVSPFCTRLTSITPEILQTHGIPFADACAQLETRHDSRNIAWGSWGDYDRKMFRAMCAIREIPYPFSPVHLNIKHLFAGLYGCRRCGMAEALHRLDLPLEGTHHRGADDAHNIARILAKIAQDHTPQAVWSRLLPRE